MGFDGLRCRALWGLLMVMWVVMGLMGSVMGCDRAFQFWGLWVVQGVYGIWVG